jgi:hypothetical protein
MKNKTKLYDSSPERWSTDPNKAVFYELEFRGFMMKPGTKFKIKGEHTIFIFACLVHNISKDVTWVECQEEKGGFRSFYPSKIAKVIAPKVSYRRKNV